MIAYELAEMCGTVDVDGVLDSMTPQQFDEWCVRDSIVPIGHTRKMLAYIAWLIASYVSREKIEPKSLMPWLQFTNTDQPDNAQARDLLKSVLGRQI
mgnify:CR=1 FL=1